MIAISCGWVEVVFKDLLNQNKVASNCRSNQAFLRTLKRSKMWRCRGRGGKSLAARVGDRVPVDVRMASCGADILANSWRPQWWVSRCREVRWVCVDWSGGQLRFPRWGLIFSLERKRRVHLAAEWSKCGNRGGRALAQIPANICWNFSIHGINSPSSFWVRSGYPTRCSRSIMANLQFRVSIQKARRILKVWCFEANPR